MIRKSGKWNDLRLSGVLAWIHRLVMLITFPIRRFWQILAIVLALVVLLLIAHFYYGIGFEHVQKLYHSTVPVKELMQTKDEVLTDMSERMEQIKNTAAEAIPVAVTDTTCATSAEAAPEKKHFAAWNVPEFKKTKQKPADKTAESSAKDMSWKDQMAERLKAKKSAPEEEKADHTVTVKEETTITTKEVYAETQQKDPIVERPKVLKEVPLPPKAEFYDGEITDYYVETHNRGLTYLSEPEVYYGTADIVGPNSIFINNTFMFLYGIYTDPREYNVKDATVFLKVLTDKTQIRCEVVAYATQTQTATALCFTKEGCINRAMVRYGYARNVAIK